MFWRGQLDTFAALMINRRSYEREVDWQYGWRTERPRARNGRRRLDAEQRRVT
ncbi:Uncharacterised protein [Serratia rubidaea]|uniref:Uncharacterized protein n=1 Tax=Serratia rubidaea TaxID=61652 RepID=A0A4U9HUA3_SERRU|nr:Uncharacterised protein [Serratia rubidaea]